MKRRKNLIMAITIFMICLLGIFTKETKASELTGYMGVQTYRESGYGYRIKDSMPPSTGINVWKIVNYPNYISTTNPGTIDWSNSIYCVRAGVGFTANNKIVNYTKNYDMKEEKDTVLNVMSSILSSNGLTSEQIDTYKGNYNKILWILDNMYVPAKSATDEARADKDRNTLLANAGINSNYFSTITDDDIEVVQQLVLWYYTNFDDTDYHKENFQTIFLGENDNFKALADYGASGEMRQYLMQTLFTYFIQNAENNASYESTTVAPLTITKDEAFCTEEASEYKFGPYEITKNSNLPYELDITFSQASYTLKDENGNIITDLEQKVKELAIGETLKVYAVVSKTSEIQEGLEFEYTLDYTITTATFITTDANTANNEQPLVNVEKDPETETDKVVIPIPKKEFDLSLRKFITQINGKDVQISREPVVDTTPLKNGKSTADYKHTKQPLSVRVGDVVTYTIRVYNEGEIDGYVSEITDYLPEWLDFIPEDEQNINYGWLIDGDRKVKTNITAKDTEYTQMQEMLYQSRGDKGTKLSLYDGGDTLDYIDVQINCRVNDEAVKGILITNIADISGMTDETGTTVEADRDSIPANAPVLSGEELENYIGKDTNKTDLSDTGYYYKGQEDDDDFEKLVIEEFDLALRKFITGVNNTIVTNRVPALTTDTNGNIVYTHTKEPVEVANGDIVTYTIRVYNEGSIAGYATQIKDNIPDGLEFLPEEQINIDYGWKMVDESGNETQDSSKAVAIVSEYLADKLLNAYDSEAGITNTNPSYQDIQVAFKVTEPNSSNRIITNKAEINADSDDDIDSIPGEWNEGEDDQDIENIKLKEFDLALRKFITGVNNTIVTNRVPSLTIDSNGKIVYTHTKAPVEVANGDIVTYTIRVYNEGEVAGYATQIKDNIPDGLEFLPEEQININYGWKMVDESGNETQDSSKASAIVSEYLADKLLNAYDSEAGIANTNPSYQDIQVAFKVTEPNNSNRIITNKAEINADSDDDIDSIPGEWNEGEDDQDIENIKLKEFDLALRKFIIAVSDDTNIESSEYLKNSEGFYKREPDVDTSKLNTIGENGELITTAIYNHTKEPVEVKKNDIVIYMLRVYNEAEVDGYAAEIKDHLPSYLEFVEGDFNKQYGWEVSQDGRTVTTNYLEDELIKAAQWIPQGNGITSWEDLYELHYKEVPIMCRVKDTAKVGEAITNIADITKYLDKYKQTIEDRDSEENNVVLPDDENLPTYKNDETGTYIPGQEDDDDFEKVIIRKFDLALRKFITGVNDKAVDNRYPELSYDEETGNIVYTHTKEPVEVETNDIVTYTIRVYNEGEVAGYAEEIKDNIPEGLEFLPDNTINTEYGWKMYKVVETDGEKEYIEVTDAKEATYITTDYLSEGKETKGRDNLIRPFDKEAALSTEEPYNPDYRDVKVAFKVTEPNTSDRIIVNRAEIQEDSNDDIDSIPGEWNDGEDDQDIEKIKVKYFDLALRKFITAVDNTQINNRYPELFYDLDTEGIAYLHTKEPVEVLNGNIVTYTIRVYNEGEVAGYAEEIKDNIPEGLEFLPDNTVNTEYGWKMYKVVETDGEKEYVEVTDAKEATYITTDYLSEGKETEGKDNLIKPFDKEAALSTEEPYNPDYRDVKVAFKVTEPNTSDRIVINRAEIQQDSGDDIDSTPGEWNDGEDDQDIEKIKVKYFDLALKKWVTQAIISENGKTNIVETGHTGDENPEPIVKVEIQSKKINTVTVKFRYSIKITNEGEIAGYAYEVKDYIPGGLKFVAEDNPAWTDLGNGVISTTQLENTLLQPGESATVEVLLTWINGQDNMGLKVNIAEISKDSHDDIDSTPDNYVSGEDDIDDAPVMLAVRTGQMQIYFLLTGIILTTIIAGIILIKKFVL